MAIEACGAGPLYFSRLNITYSEFFVNYILRT